MCVRPHDHAEETAKDCWERKAHPAGCSIEPVESIRELHKPTQQVVDSAQRAGTLELQQLLDRGLRCVHHHVHLAAQKTQM